MLRKLIRRRLGYAIRESVLSPADVADQIARRPHSASFFDANRLLKNEAPAGFRTTKFSDEYVLFQSDKKPASLLVCFTDKHRGLFMSVPTFLQLIGAENFDVIVVHDKKRARHFFGIEGFTSSLYETVQKINDHITTRGYRHVVTFGSSLGGFTAISAGLMLGADRAVSIGGTFLSFDVWVDLDIEYPTAFDPICDCFDLSKTEIAALYCENTSVDIASINQLKKIAPAANLISCASRKHNILAELKTANTEREFFNEMFDLKRSLSSFDYEQFL